MILQKKCIVYDLNDKDKRDNIIVTTFTTIIVKKKSL